MTSRTRVLVSVLVAAVLVVGGGVYWFLRDDSPAAVDIDTAAGAITTTTGSTDTTAGDAGETDGAGSETGTMTGSVDGTWDVDTTTGDFDYESATGSFAGFRISENLASIGSTTAVGRTGDVSGSIAIEGTTLTAAKFQVDLTTITTETSMRDGKVQEALETDRFPTATFELTEPVELGADATDGSEVTVDATGDLTVHGVTREVTVPITAKLVGDTIVVVGSVELTFSDYDVAVPESRMVVSVDDHGILEMQLLLTK